MNSERSQNCLILSYWLLTLAALGWLIAGTGWLTRNAFPFGGFFFVLSALFSFVACPLALISSLVSLIFDWRKPEAWYTIIVSVFAAALALWTFAYVFRGFGGGVA